MEDKTKIILALIFSATTLMSCLFITEAWVNSPTDFSISMDMDNNTLGAMEIAERIQEKQLIQEEQDKDRHDMSHLRHLSEWKYEEDVWRFQINEEDWIACECNETTNITYCYREDRWIRYTDDFYIFFNNSTKEDMIAYNKTFIGVTK